MFRYGLIGYPLTHSFSAKYFEDKFEREGVKDVYHLYPVSNLDHIQSFIQDKQLNGFNVTIPFKEKIMAYLDEIDEIAEKVGAVNCVTISQNKWKGYNTDVIGFETSLLRFTSLRKKKALIFGTGGSSLAVRYVLEKHEVPYLLVSRNEIENGITYGDLTSTIFTDHTLLINTTPVGTFPDTEAHLPIPFHLIHAAHVVFDLIYNPEKTFLLRMVEERGGAIKNGYEMLALQAEASYDLFKKITLQ